MTRPVALVTAVVLTTASFFLLLAMVSYGASQIGGASPAGSNLLGLGGAWCAYGLIRLWGLASLLVPVLMAGWAWALWKDNDLSEPGRRFVGCFLLIPACAGLAHLIPVRLGESLLVHWDQLQDGGLGGAVGYVLCGPPSRLVIPIFPGGILTRHLDQAGSALALLFTCFGAVLLIDLGLSKYLRRAWRELRTGTRETDVSDVRMSTAPFVAAPAVVKAKRRATTSINAVAKRIEAIERREISVGGDAEDLVARIRAHMRDPQATVPPIIEDEATEITRRDTPTIEEPVAAPISVAAAAPAPVEEPVPVRPAPERPAAAIPAAPTPTPARRRTAEAEGDYALPPVTLLDQHPARKEAEHELEKQQTAKAIEDAFSSFNIGVQVTQATRGPVVTQYEMKLLDQGMRVNKVEGFDKDLQMKLGTEGIRIVAPLPNKNAVGIEVPNRIKEAVVMRDLVEETDCASMALPVILGRDAVGRPLVTDLAKAPHLLVAGATGMGKSVCMNAMICSILLFKGPDEVKFIMIDPKMVELAGYEDIPHLLSPPITDMTKAHAALEWACKMMDARYEALKQVGVRDIGSFNALGEDEVRFRLAKRGIKLEDLSFPKARMEYIVVLVDEYADLMMVNKEVEKSIVRLAAKSRACGIHVILTTQRPSADVVTGLIKSNLPSRICFRVVDKSNSRVVLDISGAENLLGKGDMLFLQPGTSFPVRGQGVWLKDSEITAIVDHAKSQGTPEYDEEIVNVGAVANLGGGAPDAKAGGSWVTDRQLHEGVQAMYRHNKTGADFLRRKLNIGYNRATEIRETCEDLGLTGPAKNGQSAEFLKSWDDWIDMLKGAGHTWEEGDDIYLNPVEVH